MWHLALEVSADYYTRPPGIVILLKLTITYIQKMALHIHIQGRFNNHTVHSVYRIMIMATSVMGVMKMENIVPRVGLKPTSLAFWASVLSFQTCRLPDLTTMHMSSCLCGSLPQRSVQTTIILYLVSMSLNYMSVSRKHCWRRRVLGHRQEGLLG